MLAQPFIYSSPSFCLFTQISCVSSSTELANRVRFRYYFQMLPSEGFIAPAYFGIIRHYRWRRVGLIVQNENLFTVVWSDTDIKVTSSFDRMRSLSQHTTVISVPCSCILSLIQTSAVMWYLMFFCNLIQLVSKACKFTTHYTCVRLPRILRLLGLACHKRGGVPLLHSVAEV